jgi:hypothetical protein
MKMSKPEHNDENIKLLANEVTESMDLSTIQEYFYEGQWDYYKNDREAFETDWEDMGMEL